MASLPNPGGAAYGKLRKYHKAVPDAPRILICASERRAIRSRIDSTISSEVAAMQDRYPDAIFVALNTVTVFPESSQGIRHAPWQSPYATHGFWFCLKDAYTLEWTLAACRTSLRVWIDGHLADDSPFPPRQAEEIRIGSALAFGIHEWVLELSFARPLLIPTHKGAPIFPDKGRCICAINPAKRQIDFNCPSAKRMYMRGVANEVIEHTGIHSDVARNIIRLYLV